MGTLTPPREDSCRRVLGCTWWHSLPVGTQDNPGSEVSEGREVIFQPLDVLTRMKWQVVIYSFNNNYCKSSKLHSPNYWHRGAKSVGPEELWVPVILAPWLFSTAFLWPMLSTRSIHGTTSFKMTHSSPWRSCVGQCTDWHMHLFSCQMSQAAWEHSSE